MLRAEQVTWISEPSTEDKKYKAKFHRWSHRMCWTFKAQFENHETGKMEPCETPFLMSEESHNVFLAEVELLKLIGTLGLEARGQYRTILDLIEKYGDTCEQKGRADVEEDWAESDTGTSL